MHKRHRSGGRRVSGLRSLARGGVDPPIHQPKHKQKRPGRPHQPAGSAPGNAPREMIRSTCYDGRRMWPGRTVQCRRRAPLGPFPTESSVQNPLHRRDIKRSLAEVGDVAGLDFNRQIRRYLQAEPVAPMRNPSAGDEVTADEHVRPVLRGTRGDPVARRYKRGSRQGCHRWKGCCEVGKRRGRRRRNSHRGTGDP